METYISSYMKATNLNLSSALYFIGSLVLIYITHWTYRWMNPKCNGVLPPGSMGLPFIGETIQLVTPSASLALPPFIKNRLKRYGPIFKTNVARRPMIITADPEFNQFLLRQDEQLVVTWSMDTFAEIFDEAHQSTSRKYTRNLVLNYFGTEALRDRLLPQLEDVARKTLATWATRESVEIKSVAITMAIDFAAKQLVSGDLENTPLKLADTFEDIIGGLMSFPINVPGTSHHKCLKVHKKIREMMRDVVRKRMAESERKDGDLLDHLIDDSKTMSFINEDFIVQLLFGLFFVTSDSVSTTLALAFKLIAEHPQVLQELTAEHEAILKKKEDPNSSLTWDDYKSMTFTLQVIKEVLRLGNVTPGLFRRALKDIPVNGYIIPKGWVILIATAGLHLNESQFEEPLKFNPWRWKEIQPSVVAKSFMPFGWGMKQCAGAEYSRVLLATFIHVLVTKYRWEFVKGGKIIRTPIIKFLDGFHYKILEKQK